MADSRADRRVWAKRPPPPPLPEEWEDSQVEEGPAAGSCSAVQKTVIGIFVQDFFLWDKTLLQSVYKNLMFSSQFGTKEYGGKTS